MFAVYETAQRKPIERALIYENTGRNIAYINRAAIYETARRTPVFIDHAAQSYCKYALKECRKALASNNLRELERASQIIKHAQHILYEMQNK